MTINPFVNYNFGAGWFVGTSPITTANWDAGGAKWTVGGQFGRLIKIADKLPVNLLAAPITTRFGHPARAPGSCARR